MQTERKGEELLEYLSRACGCVYLSDLRGLRLPAARVRRVLEAVSPARYTLAEWREAAEYLSALGITPADEAAARKSIQTALSE